MTGGYRRRGQRGAWAVPEFAERMALVYKNRAPAAGRSSFRLRQLLNIHALGHETGDRPIVISCFQCRSRTVVHPWRIEFLMFDEPDRGHDPAK